MESARLEAEERRVTRLLAGEGLAAAAAAGSSVPRVGTAGGGMGMGREDLRVRAPVLLLLPATASPGVDPSPSSRLLCEAAEPRAAAAARREARLPRRRFSSSLSLLSVGGWWGKMGWAGGGSVRVCACD